MADERRGSARERGYDRTWEEFRAWYISRHPLCLDCMARDILTAATDVHHIHKLRDGGARLDESNCMALCHACHSTRTARGE